MAFLCCFDDCAAMLTGLPNASLGPKRVARLTSGRKPGKMELPVIIPILGGVVCVGLIVARLTDQGADSRAPIIAGAFLLLLALMYFVLKPKDSVQED